MNDQLEKPQGVETLEPVEPGFHTPNWAETPVKPRTAEAPRPVRKAQVTRTAFEDNEEEDTFFTRHRGKLFIGAVLAIGGGIGYLMTLEKSSAPARKAPEKTISIQLPPPPPPPPPPPKIQPPPPPEQKMIEQQPLEEKPEEPKPAEEPQPTIGTNIKGEGPGLSGLSNRGDGTRIGGGGAGGRAGGKWDGYARGLQSRISDQLRSNRKTKSASIRSLMARIWVDATGRISRANLSGSSGNAALDSAILNEVLTGLQLKEAPPQGMPSPIVIRINSRRPN